MPSQIQKLEARASHLLDAFIALRERYALLHPMLFDASVSKARGSLKQARGFKILRHSLFLSCAQDIAKLALDSDKRTPSIHNVVGALEDTSLRKELEDRYSVWVVPSIDNETDPEIVLALKEMEKQERKERRVQFTEHYAELVRLWASVSTSKAMEGFANVRDKVSAHTEVRFVADKYQLIDIAALGIKWGDLRQTIESMQRLVELIGFIVRNAGFAWEALDGQLSAAALNFWSVPNAAS
jgi:AbiU2